MRFAESVNEAIAILETIPHPAFNAKHARGVADLCLNISSFYDVDREILETAAWWHDTGRIDGTKNHEFLSASLAYENLALHGFNKEECRKVHDTILTHRTTGFPRTIEGRILKDADKLDLVSVERWMQVLDSKNRGIIIDLSEMRNMVKIIPKMRNGILQLEKSKEIFDQMITPLLDYLSSSRDSELRRYFDELIHRALL